MADVLLDYLVISETKLNQSFLNTQFNLNGFGAGARKDSRGKKR